MHFLADNYIIICRTVY